MKKIIKLIAAILSFPFLAFSQWTAISPLDNEIMIESNNHENIILTKYFDTVSFSDWKRDLKLNGLLDQGFTGLDFNKLDLIDSSELSQAYEAACVGCWLKWPASPQATIEFPEMNFLYRGYDNVFKLAANWPDGVKEYRIEATDATVKTVTRRNQLMHTINPKGKVSEVKVIYKDAEGFEKEFGPWTYGVRAFPKPEIVKTTVSKSKGGKIAVALSNAVVNVTFRIIRIELSENSQIIDDQIIPAELLKKVKVEKMIPITVTAYNNLTEEEVVLFGSVLVEN